MSAPGVSSKGASYIFVKSGASWTTTSTPTATLRVSTGIRDDAFGYSVGISVSDICGISMIVISKRK